MTFMSPRPSVEPAARNPRPRMTRLSGSRTDRSRSTRSNRLFSGGFTGAGGVAGGSGLAGTSGVSVTGSVVSGSPGVVLYALFVVRSRICATSSRPLSSRSCPFDDGRGQIAREIDVSVDLQRAQLVLEHVKRLGVKLHVERVVRRLAQHVELARDAQQVVVVVVNLERLDREVIRLEDQAGRDLAVT